MKSWYMISIMMFIFSMLGFMLNNKHILVMLLMTEFMVLSIIIMMSMEMGISLYSWVVLVVIFILVCESVMGISSVILISRLSGGDYLENMSLTKC